MNMSIKILIMRIHTFFIRVTAPGKPHLATQVERSSRSSFSFVWLAKYRFSSRCVCAVALGHPSIILPVDAHRARACAYTLFSLILSLQICKATCGTSNVMKHLTCSCVFYYGMSGGERGVGELCYKRCKPEWAGQRNGQC